MIDFGILAGLTTAGTPVFIANCISASVAVCFVFAVAQRRTFVHDSSWIVGKFIIYTLYNTIAILIASLAVASLTRSVIEPHLGAWSIFDALSHDSNRLKAIASLIAKVAITPLTLYANFLFMGWLLEGKVSIR